MTLSQKIGLVCAITCLLFAHAQQAFSQKTDTLQGYYEKQFGEEITYFSPLKQLANQALLTRCLGNMPVRWASEPYAGKADSVCYELLIGHSTGTSKGVRSFQLSLNKTYSWTLETQPQQKGMFVKSGTGPGGRWRFVAQEYDVNGDVFGKLFITIPAALAKNAPQWELTGLDLKSRDWMMVFMYRRAFRADVNVGQLLLRNSDKRQITVLVENPYPTDRKLNVLCQDQELTIVVNPGFNSVPVAAFNASKSGNVNLTLQLEGDATTLTKEIVLTPVKHRTFHIIHHSHNDIGYSHHQTEVEKIQTQNIRAALRWIKANRGSQQRPIWHIESLWAVENFMKTASVAEKNLFAEYVQSGQIVLSGNFANILTGLCRPQEQSWALEYGNSLRKDMQMPIKMVMTTDIPGISASAMQAYLDNGYTYLSLGPNYVKNLPDHGDRIGSMLEAQGDQIFWWKPNAGSDKKLMVWTAGRGYSMFHGISDSEKQYQWEQRLSDYMNELDQRNYPYEDIQLRYTKNADNGPVDTLLLDFIRQWNERYASPRLELSSIPELFDMMAKKHGDAFPVLQGEITPYWEDGAYSTAAEEIEARQLAAKTIQLEQKMPQPSSPEVRRKLYQLHRNLVLFHEHTWGAWCSITDPDNSFTTDQWIFKKAFLDSARLQYQNLESHFAALKTADNKMVKGLALKIVPDTLRGGFTLYDQQGRLLADTNQYRLFEPIYMLGVNPMKREALKLTSSKSYLRSGNQVYEQTFNGTGFNRLMVRVTHDKRANKLDLQVVMDKIAVREKEALHIALPIGKSSNELRYNNNLVYPTTQLPGSNKEFVCVENALSLKSAYGTWQMESPDIALIEIGSPIDENRPNGAKVWKRDNQNLSNLFLYVLNNYWHTNYKADQAGEIKFNFSMWLGQ